MAPNKTYSPQRRVYLAALFFLAPALLIMLFFTYVPMVVAFYYSLCEYSGFHSPQFIGLKNFSTIFQDRVFRLALGNSILYLVVTPFIIILSIFLASLVEKSIRGMHFFRVSYYIPVITPVVVVGIIWTQLFADELGFINRILLAQGILENPIPFLSAGRRSIFTAMFVTLWRGLGYYMVIFLAALQTIPVTLLEASRIDGANKLQEILHVKIPLLRPSIVLASLISCISALKVFEEVYIMFGPTGGIMQANTTAVLRIYEVSFYRINPAFGQASAMAVILFLIILCFSVLNYYLSTRRGYQGEV